MASSLWEIEYGDLRQSATAWGATNLVRRRRSLEADELTFRLARVDAFADCPFAYDQQLTLWRGNECWFTGRVQPPAVTADANGESWYITVANAWQTLQEITYRQYRTLQNEDFSGLTMRLSTQVVLGQDPWGRKRSTDWVIGNIAAFALTQAAGTFVVSSIAEGVTPPYQDARDITCAAAILRQLEWTPDAASWFDYSTTPPLMVIQRRGGAGVLTIDLAETPIKGLASLRRRDDMVPRGVVFTFGTTEVNELTGESVPRNTEQSVGATEGPRVIYCTFQLAAGEEIPTGLALAFNNSLALPFWEGTLQRVEPECTGFARPGHLLHLANGNPAWATMWAVVNDVAEDIDHGTTTLSLGLPRTLSAGDFVALMSRGRDSRPPSDDANKNHNGTEGVPEENGGLGGAPALPGDPHDDDGKVPPGDRQGNAGAGTASGVTGAANSTVSFKVCDDAGHEKLVNVIGA